MIFVNVFVRARAAVTTSDILRPAPESRLNPGGKSGSARVYKVRAERLILA